MLNLADVIAPHSQSLEWTSGGSPQLIRGRLCVIATNPNTGERSPIKPCTNNRMRSQTNQKSLLTRQQKTLAHPFPYPPTEESRANLARLPRMASSRWGRPFTLLDSSMIFPYTTLKRSISRNDIDKLKSQFLRYRPDRSGGLPT